MIESTSGLIFFGIAAAFVTGYVGWLAGSRKSLDQLNDAQNRQSREHKAEVATLKEDLIEVRLALNRLPDAVIALDPEHKFLWQNSTSLALLGEIGAGRFISAVIRQPEFVSWLKNKKNLNADQQAVEDPDENSPLAQKEFFKLNFPGSVAQVYEAQLVDPDEGFLLLILRNVTQREQLDRMRRDFVANVSHEIRTPLTVIHGFAEALKDQEFERSLQQQYLDLIIKQSHTLRHLVDDLLALSTLENTQLPPTDEVVDLQQLLEGQVADARVISGGKHRISIASGEAVLVHGSRREMETAIRNLIGNALRYTPDGGAIAAGVQVIHSKALEGEIHIHVTDSGIGIANEHLSRITERFYRVDKARSRDSGGTGLGLAIVKRVAMRHDGRLDIQSSLGTGSCFTIALPRERSLSSDAAIGASSR